MNVSLHLSRPHKARGLLNLLINHNYYFGVSLHVYLENVKVRTAIV